MVSTLEGIVRNTPAGAPVLVERIDAKTRNTRHFEGEIRFKKFFVVLALLIIHDVVDKLVHLLVLHRRQVDAANITIDTNHRRQTRRKVQVRCTLLGAEGQ